jgi:hypothetical protein
MSFVKILALPVLIAAVAVIYFFVSDYEWAGAVLLLIFAIAMAVMGWILVPAFDDVGPTAPVDPDWHERQA